MVARRPPCPSLPTPCELPVPVLVESRLAAATTASVPVLAIPAGATPFLAVGVVWGCRNEQSGLGRRLPSAAHSLGHRQVGGAPQAVCGWARGAAGRRKGQPGRPTDPDAGPEVQRELVEGRLAREVSEEGHTGVPRSREEPQSTHGGRWGQRLLWHWPAPLTPVISVKGGQSKALTGATGALQTPPPLSLCGWVSLGHPMHPMRTPLLSLEALPSRGCPEAGVHLSLLLRERCPSQGSCDGEKAQGTSMWDTVLSGAWGVMATRSGPGLWHEKGRSAGGREACTDVPHRARPVLAGPKRGAHFQ